METLNKLESRAAGLFQNVPHLPSGLRRWIADNVWWLLLIIVILASLGVIGLLIVVLLLGVVLTFFTGPIGAAIGGIALVVSFVVSAFTILNIAISVFAISPLKHKVKRGWSLLFLITIINVLSVFVIFLFTFEFVSFLLGLLFAGIFMYILFEIRSFYISSSINYTHDPSVEVIPPTKK